MAQFQYTAVNSSGKKLSGIIGAANEEEARKQLNTLGISLLGIQQVAETAQQSSTQEPGTSKELEKFEFEAIDKNGQKVLGTIPASSRYKAFKRLVEEYQFEVSYVVTLGASPEEKVQAKQDDLSVLKAEYEAKHQTEVAKPEEVRNEAFEKKRAQLLKKVDFILEKIRALLANYQGEIKPENEKIIQQYIDKLLRIKSSTNLDYIENTSEELLKKVQDQELFLHKEKMQDKHAKVKLETQKLMAELHAKPDEIRNVGDDLQDIHDKLEESESRLLKGISQWLEPFLTTPEEKALQHQINSTTRQIWTYRKIWFTSPKSSKADAKQSLDAVIQQRIKLKGELKALKSQRRGKASATAPTEKTVSEPLITEEVTHFLGWLLGFYLVAYFASYYMITKSPPMGLLPANFNLFSSELLRSLLISIFMWYALLSLRVEYLRYKNWANLLVLPFGLFLNATLIFNL